MNTVCLYFIKIAIMCNLFAINDQRQIKKELSLESCIHIALKRKEQVTNGVTFAKYRASYVALVVNPPANAGDIRDMNSIPGLGRSHGKE